MKKITLILVTLVLSILFVGCSNKDYAQMWTAFSYEDGSYEIGFAALNSNSNYISVEGLTLNITIQNHFSEELYDNSYILDDYTLGEDEWYRFIVSENEILSSSNVGIIIYHLYQEEEILDSYTYSTNKLQVEDKYDQMYQYAIENGESYDYRSRNGYKLLMESDLATYYVVFFEDESIVILNDRYGESPDFYSNEIEFTYNNQYPIDLYLNAVYNYNNEYLSHSAIDQSVMYYISGSNTNIELVSLYTNFEVTEEMTATSILLLEDAMNSLRLKIRNDLGLIF